MRAASLPILALALALGALVGCAARIPKGRYGVEALDISGVEALDPYALRACLATRERDSFALDLSKAQAPSCGERPFDAHRIHLPLWRWRWTEWPLYDPGVFERDLSRIERWYRARGYYGARVVDATSTPPEALFGSSSSTDRVALHLRVEEGAPVLIQQVSLQGTRGLDAALAADLSSASKELTPGARFDESTFDTVKDKLLRTLRDAGYAEAELDARVDLDPVARSAMVAFELRPGALMEVGAVCIEGHGSLPAQLILQAADLRPGRPFSESDIEDARTRIYQLRVLSEVEITAGSIDPKTGTQRFTDSGRSGELAPLSGEAGAPEESTERICRLPKANRKRPQVPIEIRVKPGKLYRFGVGAGLQIGVEDGQRAINATQQWDVHLFGYGEAHNVFGGLRRLRIEERPKLIFLAPFPRVAEDNGSGGNGGADFRLGNNLSTLLEWPAFVEARTLLRLTATWDRGPDPYGGHFIRDDFDVGLGPSRSFFRNRLTAGVSVHVNPYVPRFTYGTAEERAAVDLNAERYDLLFLQQLIEWDTRNDRSTPTRGVYGRLEVLEALPPSSWRYVRVTPELRGFVPLPYGLVLAARAGLGVIWLRGDGGLTEELGRLGPRPYRLRGGGPYSVRGIQAGLLGLRDGQDNGFPGGTRSWIASLELRVPLGDSFGVATFVDTGDVDGGSDSQRPRFRLDHPSTTMGAGLRYKTIVGPIRLDVGVLVPGLQGRRGDDRNVSFRDPLFRLNGAVHLTIGEAF
jgi:Omp85 superfamily domain/Surface antigen variable number repeat